MTAQFSDAVFYRRPWSLRGRFYALAATNGTGLFSPPEHGLAPSAVLTALHRGFLCEYRVIGSRLELDTMFIYLDTPAPELFGEKPRRGDGVWESAWVYRNLRHPVAFTGGMLIGRDFVEELYIHGGEQPAWKYRNVHELVFANGLLKRAVDRTREIAIIREEFTRKPFVPEKFETLDDLKLWHQEQFTMRFLKDYEGW